MSASLSGKNKGGNRVSKLDRDTSKKNVALSKAKQLDEKAAKNFRQHQAQLKKELAAINKLKRSIDQMVRKQKEDQKLDQRFVGQAIGKVKSLRNFERFIKESAKDHSAVVQKPQAYVTIAKEVQKLPPVNGIKTTGDLSVFLAMAIVILNRVLALKTAK